MSENKTRYTVGQEIIVVGFNYGPGKEVWFNRRPFAFAEANYPLSIELFKLKVTEHHKVAWGLDPSGERRYDGFILTTDTGEVWYNQYPKASYSQVSDVADRRFTINYALMAPNPELTEEQIMERCEKLPFVTVETLEGFISVFYQAVCFAQKEIHDADQSVRNRANLIIKFFEELCTQVFKKFGKGIVIKEYNKDGRTVITKAELVGADNNGVVVEKHHLDKLLSQKHHPAK